MSNSFRKNLQDSFKLPPDAVEWLVMFYDILQVFDDFADGDKVSRKDLDKTIWNSLVGVFYNPFFSRNQSQLVPLISGVILKWQGSDTAERSGNASAMSFVWRAGYFDIVLASVAIVHGHEAASDVAHSVMELYGENLDDYLEEFKHA